MSHAFRFVKAIERTCGNIVRSFSFDSPLISLFPPFSMASGVLCSLSQKKPNYYKTLSQFHLVDRLEIGISDQSTLT